ncbi:Hypothetical protein GSB_153079, partial [Giardia duodenalis]
VKKESHRTWHSDMPSLLGTLSDITVIFISLGAVLLFGGVIYSLYFVVPILLAKLTQAIVNLYFRFYAKGYQRTRVHISYLRLGLFMRRIHLQNIYFSTAEYTIFVGDIHLHFSLLRNSGFLGKVLWEHVTKSQAKDAHSLTFPSFPAIVHVTGLDVHLYSRKPLPYEPTEEGLQRYIEECQSKLAGVATQRKLPFLFRVFGPVNLEVRGVRLVLSNPYLRCGIRATVGSASGVTGVYQEAELFTVYTLYIDLKLHSLNINFIENEFYNPIFDSKRQTFFEKKASIPLYCGRNSLSVSILSSPVSRLTFTTTSDLSKVPFRPGLHSSQDRSEIYDKSFPEGIISIRLIEPKITYSPWLERERKRIFSSFFPETFLPRPVWPLPANEELFFRPTLNYKISVIFDTPGTIQYWYRNTDQPYDPLKHDIILAWKRAQMESVRVSQQLREFKTSSTISYDSNPSTTHPTVDNSMTTQGLASSRGTANVDDDDCLESVSRSMYPTTTSPINSSAEEANALLGGNYSTSLAQLQPMHSRKGSNLSSHTRMKSSTTSKFVLDGIPGQAKRLRIGAQGSPLAGGAADELEVLMNQNQQFQSVANLQTAVFNDDLFAQFNLDSNALQMDNFDEPIYNAQSIKDDDQAPEERTLRQPRTLLSTVFSNTIPFVNRFIRSSASKGEQVFNIFDTSTENKNTDKNTTPPPTVGAYTSPHEGISFTCSAGTIILLQVPVFSYIPTRTRKVTAFVPHVSAKTTVIKQEFFVAENVSFVWDEFTIGAEYSAPTKWNVGFFAENFRMELNGAIISQITHLLGDLAEDDSDLLSYYRKSLIPLIDNSTIILAHEFPIRNRGFDLYCNVPPNRLQTIKEVQYSRMKRFIPVTMEFTIRVVNYEIGVVTAADNVYSSMHHLSAVQPIQDFLIHKYSVAYHRLYCQHKMLTEHDFKEIRLVSAHHYVPHNNPFLNMFWRIPIVIGSSSRSIYSLLDLTIDVINNDYEQVTAMLQNGTPVSESLRPNLDWLNTPYNVLTRSTTRKRRCGCFRRGKKSGYTIPTVSMIIQDSENLIPSNKGYAHSRYQSTHDHDTFESNTRSMRKGSKSCDETSIVPASAHSAAKLSSLHVLHQHHTTSWDTLGTSSASFQQNLHPCTVDEFLKVFSYDTPDAVDYCDHRIELLRIANNKKHANSNPLTYEEYLSLLTYAPATHSRLLFAGVDLSCGLTVPRLHNINAYITEDAGLKERQYIVLDIRLILKATSIYVACASASRQHHFLKRLYSAKKAINKSLVSPFTSGPLPRTELRMGTAKEILLDAHLDAPVIEPSGKSTKTSPSHAIETSSPLDCSCAQGSTLSLQLNILLPELLVSGSVIALYMHFLDNLFLAPKFPISEADYIIMPFNLRFKNQLARAYESYYLYRRLEASYANDLWLSSIQRAIKDSPKTDSADRLTDRDILIRLSQEATLNDQLTYSDVVYPITKAVSQYRRFSHYITSMKLLLTIHADRPTVSVTVHEFTELPHRFSFAYSDLHAEYDRLFATSLSDARSFITLRTSKLTFAILSSQSVISLSVSTTPLQGTYISHAHSKITTGGFDMHVIMPKTHESLYSLTTRTAYTMTLSTLKLSVYPEFVSTLTMVIRHFCLMFVTPSFNRTPTSFIDYNMVNRGTNTTSEVDHTEIYNHIKQIILNRMQTDLELLTNQSNFLLLCNYLENLTDSDHATILHRLYAKKPPIGQMKIDHGSFLLDNRTNSLVDGGPSIRQTGNHPDLTCSAVSSSSPSLDDIIYARCPDRLRYLLFYNGANWRLNAAQVISFDISIGQFDCSLIHALQFDSTLATPTSVIASVVSKRGVVCYINNHALKDTTRLFLRCTVPDIILRLREPFSQSTSVALKTALNVVIQQTGDNAVNKTVQSFYQEHHRHIISTVLLDSQTRTLATSIPTIVVSQGNDLTCFRKPDPVPVTLEGTVPVFMPTTNYCYPNSAYTTTEFTRRASSKTSLVEQYPLPTELEEIIRKEKGDNALHDIALRRAMYMQFIAPGIATTQKRFSRQRASIKTASTSSTTFYSTETDTYNDGDPGLARESTRLSRTMITAHAADDSSLYSTESTAGSAQTVQQGVNQNSYDETSDSILLPDEPPPRLLSPRSSECSWKRQVHQDDHTEEACAKPISVDQFAGIEEAFFPFLLPAHPFHSIVDPRLLAIYTSVSSSFHHNRSGSSGLAFRSKPGPYMGTVSHQSNCIYNPTTLPSDLIIPTSDPANVNISISIEKLRVYIKPEGIYATLLLVSQILSPDFTVAANVYTLLTTESSKSLLDVKHIYLCEMMLRTCYHVHLRQFLASQKPSRFHYISNLLYSQGQIDLSQTGRKDGQELKNSLNQSENRQEKRDRENSSEKVFMFINLIASQSQLLSSLNLSHFGRATHHPLEATIAQLDGTSTRRYVLFTPQIEQYKLINKETITIEVSVRAAEVVALVDHLRTNVALRISQLSLAFALNSKVYSFNNHAYKIFCRLTDKFCPQANANRFRVQLGTLLSLKASDITLDTTGGTICTIQNVSLKLNHGAFLSQGGGNIHGGSKQSSVHSSAKKSPMKVDAMLSHKDKSVKTDTGSTQSAQHTHSHTSKDVTDLTDKSTSSRKNTDTSLKIFLNTLCVEASSVSFNIVVMLLQPLVILATHYMVSFQRGEEAIVLSATISNLSRYIFLKTFTSQRRLVWHGLKSTSDVTESRNSLVSNLCTDFSDTQLHNLLIILSQKENNPSFEMTSKSVFIAFYKDLAKDPAISIGSRLRNWQKSVEQKQKSTDGGSQSRGPKLEFSIQSICRAQKCPPTIYKIKIDTGLKLVPLRSDAILLLALSIKEYNDTLSPSTDSTSLKQLVFWQNPRFETFRIPKEPVILQLNHMTKHLYVKSWGGKAQTTLASLQQGAGELASVKHMMQLSLSLHNELTIQVIDSTHLPYTTASNSIPPCFKAKLVKPKLNLSINERLAITLTYKTLTASFSLPLFLLASICKFNSAFYAYNLDRVTDMYHSYTYQQPPSFLINIAVNLFSTNGIYRILLNKDAHLCAETQKKAVHDQVLVSTSASSLPVSVPLAAPSATSTSMLVPPVLSNPHLAELRAFQEYEHTKVAPKEVDSSITLSAYEELSMTAGGDGTHSSSDTLTNAEPLKDDAYVTQLHTQDTLPLNQNYQSFDQFFIGSSTPNAQTGELEGNGFDALGDTFLLTKEPKLFINTLFGTETLGGPSAYVSQDIISAYSRAKLDANLVHSSPISLEDITLLRSKCSMRGQVSIRKWLLYISKLSDISIEVVFLDTTFSYVYATVETPIAVASFPSIKLTMNATPPLLDVFAYPFLYANFAADNITFGLHSKTCSVLSQKPLSFSIDESKRDYLVAIKSFETSYTQSVLQFTTTLGSTKVDSLTHVLLTHALEVNTNSFEIQFFNAHNRLLALLHDVWIEMKLYSSFSEMYSLVLSAWTDHAFYLFHEYTAQSFWDRFCRDIHSIREQKATASAATVTVDTEIPFVYSSRSTELQALQLRQPKRVHRPAPFSAGRSVKRQSAHKPDQERFVSPSSSNDTPKGNIQEQRDNLLTPLGSLSGNHVLFLSAELDEFILGIDNPRLVQCNAKLSKVTLSLSSLSHQTDCLHQLKQMTSKEVFSKIYYTISSSSKIRMASLPSMTSTFSNTTLRRNRYSPYEEDPNSVLDNFHHTQKKEEGCAQLISSVAGLLLANGKDMILVLNSAPLHIMLHSSYVNQDTIHTITLPTVDIKLLFKDLSSLIVQISVSSSQNFFSGELVVLVISLIKKLVNDIEMLLNNSSSIDKEICQMLLLTGAGDKLSTSWPSTFINPTTTSGLEEYSMQASTKAPLLRHCSIEFVLALTTLTITTTSHANVLILKELTFKMNYDPASRKQPTRSDIFARKGDGLGEFELTLNDIIFYTHVCRNQNEIYLEFHPEYLIFKTKDVEGLTKVFNDSTCESPRIIQNISSHISMSFTFTGKIPSKTALGLTLTVQTIGFLIHPLLYRHIVSLINDTRVWKESYTLIQSKYTPRTSKNSSGADTMIDKMPSTTLEDRPSTLQQTSTRKDFCNLIQFTLEFNDIDVSVYSDCGLEFILADSKMTLEGTCARETSEEFVVELAIDELIGSIQLFIVPPYVAPLPADRHNDVQGGPWSIDAVLSFLNSTTAIPTGNVFDFCLSLRLKFQTGVSEISVIKNFQCRYPKLPLESTLPQPSLDSNELCNTLQLTLTLTRFVLAINETAVPLLADFFFTSVRYISSEYSSAPDQAPTDAVRINAILTDETIENLLKRVEMIRQKTLYIKVDLSILRLGLEVYEFNDVRETIKQACEGYTNIQSSTSTSGTKIGAVLKADSSSAEAGTASSTDEPNLSIQSQIAKRNIENPFIYSCSHYGHYGLVAGGSTKNLHGKSVKYKDSLPPILSIILPRLSFDLELVKVPKNDPCLYKSFDILRPFITSDFLKMDESTKLYIKPAAVSLMVVAATLYKRTLFLPPEVFRVFASFISKWLQVIEKYSLNTFGDHRAKKSSYSTSSDLDGEVGTVNRTEKPVSMVQTQIPQGTYTRNPWKADKVKQDLQSSAKNPTAEQTQDTLASNLAGLYEILQTGGRRSSSSEINFLMNVLPDTLRMVVSLEIEQQVLILDSVARPIINRLATCILGDTYTANTSGYNSHNMVAGTTRHSRNSSKLDYAAVSPSSTNTPDHRYTKNTVFGGAAQEDMQPGYEVLSFVSINILPIKMELSATNDTNVRAIETSVTLSGLNVRVIPYAIQFISNLYKAYTAGTVDHAHPLVLSIKNVLVSITSTKSGGENQVPFNQTQSCKVNLESISLKLALHSFEHLSAVSAIWIHNTEKLRGMVAFRDIMHATSKQWSQDSAPEKSASSDKSIVGKYFLDLSITCQSVHTIVHDLSYYKLNPISSVYLAQNRAIRNRNATEKDALLTHGDIVSMILGQPDTVGGDVGKINHKRARSIMSSDNSAEVDIKYRNESTDRSTTGTFGYMQRLGQESYEEHPLHHATQADLEFGEANTGCRSQLTDQQLELILQLTALEKQQKVRVPILSVEFSNGGPALTCNIKRKATKLQATVSVGNLLLKYGHSIACKIALNGARLSIKNFSYSVADITDMGTGDPKGQDICETISTSDAYTGIAEHSLFVASMLSSNEQLMVTMETALHLDQLIVHVFEEMELAYISIGGCSANLSACHTISEKILRNQLQYKKNRTSIGLGIKNVNAYIGMQAATAIYGSLQRLLSDTSKLWMEGKTIVQNHHTALSVDNILLKLKRYISKGERNKEKMRKQKELTQNDELYLQTIMSNDANQYMLYTLDAEHLSYFSKTAKVKVSLQIDSISLRMFQSTLLDNYHCAATISKLDVILSLSYNPADQSARTIPLKLQLTKKALLERLGRELATKDKPKTQTEAVDASSAEGVYTSLAAPSRSGDHRSRFHLNNTLAMAFSPDGLQLNDRLPVTPTTSITLSIALFTLNYGERLGQGANRIAINSIISEESVDTEKVRQGLGYIHKGQYHDYIHLLAARDELSTIMSCTEVLKLGRSSWDISYSMICSVLKLPENSGPLYMLQMLSGLAKPNLSNLTAGSQFIAAVGTINSILSDILAFKRSVSRMSILAANKGDTRDASATNSMSASKEAFLHSSMDISPDDLSKLSAELSAEPKEASKAMEANMMRIHESERLWLLSQMNVENTDALLPNLGLLGKGGSDLLSSIIGSTLKNNRYLNKIFTGVTASLYRTGEDVTDFLITQAKKVFHTRDQKIGNLKATV